MLIITGKYHAQKGGVKTVDYIMLSLFQFLDHVHLFNTCT